jgi:hypothetical protein
VEVLTARDAGEVLTLQRAAYVGEAMLYDQFLPPLHEIRREPMPGHELVYLRRPAA